MKHVKTYGLFESSGGAELTTGQKKFLNKCTDGTWTYNPKTGLVDVDGDFDFKTPSERPGKKRLGSISDIGFRFGEVTGSFDCSSNEFTSLIGSPTKVGKNFNCDDTNISSLVGAPKDVGGGFYCTMNKKLISLRGGPEKVGVDFNCSYSGLTSLEGAPREVGGYFDCSHNNLRSLAESPQKVNGYFSCSSNKIVKNLEGSPLEVGGNFICHLNPGIKSLKGAPQIINGGFRCDAFVMEAGQWNTRGWIELLGKTDIEGMEMILTILTIKDINQEIQKDPTWVIMSLKGIWKSPAFRRIRNQLVIPDKHKKDLELVGDLGDLGF